jgi:hypothetical protein
MDSHNISLGDDEIPSNRIKLMTVGNPISMQNELIITLHSQDALDPEAFVTDRPRLKPKEANKLSFLGNLLHQKNMSVASPNTGSNGSPKSDPRNFENFSNSQSIKSILKANGKNGFENPLYGYRIKAIKSFKPGTEIFRIKHKVHKQFLKRGQYQKWSEKEQ